MFGLSFSEFLVIGIVALVAVGPDKLPGMLRTLGEWIRKLRNLTHDIRAQSGIDEILRAEGLHGGVSELKTLIRSAQSPFLNLNLGATGAARPNPAPSPSSEPDSSSVALPQPDAFSTSRYDDPYMNLDVDATREYPPEGPDAYGALPDDLVDDGSDPSEHVDVLNAARPLPMDPLPPDPAAVAEPPPPAVSSAAQGDLNPPSASS